MYWWALLTLYFNCTGDFEKYDGEVHMYQAYTIEDVSRGMSLPMVSVPVEDIYMDLDAVCDRVSKAYRFPKYWSESTRAFYQNE